MRDLISKSKKIVILFNDSFDIDIYASIVALTDVLKKENKEVNISTESKFPITFRDLMELKAPNNVDDLGKRRLVLSLNKKQGSVDNVTWSEDDKQVKFVIAPKADDFNVSDVKFDFVGGNFDLMVTLGVSQLEDLGKIYQSFKDTLDRTKIIVINNKQTGKQFGAKAYTNSNASSISEAVFEAVQDAGYSLSKEAGTALLTGIIWKTEGFRYGLKNSRTFKNVATLLGMGAHYNNAVQSVFGVNKEFLTLLGKVISKSKAYAEDIYGATLAREDIGSAPVQDSVSPEINVLSKMKGLKASFVLAPMADGKVWGTAHTTSKDLNLLTQLKEFKPKGDTRKVRFVVAGKAIADVEKSLVDALAGKAPKREKQGESKQSSKEKEQKKTDSPEKKARQDGGSKTQEVISLPSKSDGSNQNTNDDEPLKKAEKPPEVSNRNPSPAQSFSRAQGIPGSAPMQTAEPLPKATVPPNVE